MFVRVCSTVPAKTVFVRIPYDIMSKNPFVRDNVMSQHGTAYVRTCAYPYRDKFAIRCGHVSNACVRTYKIPNVCDYIAYVRVPECVRDTSAWRGVCAVVVLSVYRIASAGDVCDCVPIFNYLWRCNHRSLPRRPSIYIFLTVFVHQCTQMYISVHKHTHLTPLNSVQMCGSMYKNVH